MLAWRILLFIDVKEVDHVGSINADQLNFQFTLMQHFIDSNDSIVAYLHSQGNFEDVCRWYFHQKIPEGEGHLRVICFNNTVRAIEIARVGHGYAVEYIPNSVVAISIHYVTQRRQLNIRQLPLDLTKLEMVGCKLIGTISLDCLPRAIVTIDLQQNAITGAIHLLSIPKTLVHLNLRGNEIQQDVVYYKGLNMCIQVYLDGNRIGAVESLDEEEYIKQSTRWAWRGVRQGEVRY